ncbi:PhzF family phenazine biosynthesis protein [Streptomyces sp. NPDC050803]|uniref:PhzF family phenazine biosynthesis protein n=1 Tax=unclassified Streptomyces TaxID=2593676 RepID=UPI00341E8105
MRAFVRCDGLGGSPTSVTDDDPAAPDADRRVVAAAAGTSHGAFLGPGRAPDGGWLVRFFTATAELSGCGHGAVAAQAVRLTRTALGELNDRQHPGGPTFDTVVIRRPAGIEVWFDRGLVALRHPAPDERGPGQPWLPGTPVPLALAPDTPTAAIRRPLLDAHPGTPVAARRLGQAQHLARHGVLREDQRPRPGPPAVRGRARWPARSRPTVRTAGSSSRCTR